MTRTAKLTAAGVALLALTLTACDDDSVSSAAKAEKQLGAQAYEQQVKAVPYPAGQLRDSLTRRNIAQRLLRTNKPNAVSYVYLLSDIGTYLGYYVVKGSVTSTGAQMLEQDEISRCPYNDSACPVTDGPGDDGTFGTAEPGIYFFTVEGAMVTTDMRYLQSDQPLPVEAPKLNAAAKRTP